MLADFAGAGLRQVTRLHLPIIGTPAFLAAKYLSHVVIERQLLAAMGAVIKKRIIDLDRQSSDTMLIGPDGGIRPQVREAVYAPRG